MNNTQPYDVVVIGGGPGGYVAAIRAAQLGQRVAVIEREELGGICLNWGCIPSKSLLRNAEVLTLIKHAADFGISISGEVNADYAAAIKRSRGIVTTQVKGVAFLMRKNKIEVIKGTARLTARDRVAVSGGEGGDREVGAKNIIIATGSRVRMLPGVEVDGQRVITSREVWNLNDLPKRIVIGGSGPIGLEFATVFLSYGCEVTVVEMLSRAIPLEDVEMSEILSKAMTKRGLKLLTNTKVDGVQATGDGVTVRTSPTQVGQTVTVTGWDEQPQERTTEAGSGGPREIAADRFLLASGFVPNSGDLGLEEVGVTLNGRGFIEIDDQMRTSVPTIYAIGDVTGKLALAHVASAQGHVAAEVIAGHDTIRLDYNAMPKCTYTSPQVASIGLTEEQARQQHGEIKVGKYPFKPNGKAQALGELDGMVKIIGDATTGEILGAHLIGPEVTEMIGEFSLAKFLESTSEEIARAVHPHPTLSEVIAEAAMGVEGTAINI